jgi:ketosteroid isomerase-like protein
MKTQISSLITVIILAGTSCEKKIDIEKEKAAIIAVIEEETDAFYDRDFERLAATHVQDETNMRLDAGRYGYTLNTGWDDSFVKEFFIENPEPVANYEKKSNFKIKVYNGAAWAVYDNDAYNSDGELQNKSIHVQFLEKVDGQWKIDYMSIVNTTSFDRAQENGRIASLYHELKPENVDAILTDDFIGHWENDRFTWKKEDHRSFLTSNAENSNNISVKDSIYNQVIDGNWAATRFVRSGSYQGRKMNVQMMQFKRFQDGKIAEIYEYFDSRQMD